MIALLTACLFFEILVLVLNCISESVLENCVGHLKANSTAIDRSDSFKYLGVVINQTMSWPEHIDTMIPSQCGMTKITTR